MKITGYDEETGSLLVCFASDETQSSDPASYPALAFQPQAMWPDETNIERIKKNIAVAGMGQAQAQAIKEAFVMDEQRVAEMRALIGQSFEFSASDLVGATDGSNTFTPLIEVL